MFDKLIIFNNKIFLVNSFKTKFKKNKNNWKK